MIEGQFVRKLILQYDFAPERAPLWHDCDHGRPDHVPQTDRFYAHRRGDRASRRVDLNDPIRVLGHPYPSLDPTQTAPAHSLSGTRINSHGPRAAIRMAFRYTFTRRKEGIT
jgi:hypothetical protein